MRETRVTSRQGRQNALSFLYVIFLFGSELYYWIDKLICLVPLSVRSLGKVAEDISWQESADLANEPTKKSTLD